MADDDALRSELSDLQQQMNVKTDASLDSTRRMLQLASEGVEVGVLTMDQLDHQGEQLDHIEGGLDKINADVRDAERNLDDMDKCCGLCIMPWRRRRGPKSSPHVTYDKNDATESNARKENRAAKIQLDTKKGGADGGSYVTRITGDAREDEMDDNLRDVAGLVSSMRGMAIDMGDEIENQNNQLDRINRKAENNVVHINEADKRARQHLK